MLLSEEQKRTFMHWLSNERQTSEGIARQMMKLGHVPGILAGRELDYANACRLILDRLERTHSEILS